MKRILCLVAAIAAVALTGCINSNAGGNGTGPTTQPTPFLVIDPAAVDQLVEQGLQDYLTLAAAGVIKDKNVAEAAQVAQAAIDRYKAADPSTPEGNKLFAAAHDAVMKYLITQAQATASK